MNLKFSSGNDGSKRKWGEPHPEFDVTWKAYKFFKDNFIWETAPVKINGTERPSVEFSVFYVSDPERGNPPGAVYMREHRNQKEQYCSLHDGLEAFKKNANLFYNWCKQNDLVRKPKKDLFDQDS